MWIASPHAAATAAAVVAATGRPLTDLELDAAESVAETLAEHGLPLGSPTTFAATIVRALKVVEADEAPDL